MKNEHIYIAIDLKSFYASVECVARGLDPMKTNLVVADESRTEKTICLAVSPSLKAYGISGRARLFEVIQQVKEINSERLMASPGKTFSGRSFMAPALAADPSLKLSYIIAPPRMAEYVEVSRKVHDVYLKYIAPEDIHVYSIDEVFMDVTSYLKLYSLSAHDLAMKMILEVLDKTGITATAGIGTNLYLCKVAMDVMAKHIPADENGVRIAYLDEMSYRRQLWSHRPIADFWRVGRRSAKKLEKLGLYTMGDVARFSLEDYGEDQLYRAFGVNAELLIDHAWGWEPCTIADIKNYKPDFNSISSGQVLKEPYDHQKARIVVREMAQSLALELFEKELVTDKIVMSIGYDTENITNPEKKSLYKGDITIDHYGRPVPKHARGTENLDFKTSSVSLIVNAALTLYDRITDPALTIRRININADRVCGEADASANADYEQLDIFSYFDDENSHQDQINKEALEKEKKLQQASIDIIKRYGKNAILRGTDLQEGATAMERNGQIGGHKA